jgi:hypothetical protein
MSPYLGPSSQSKPELLDPEYANTTALRNAALDPAILEFPYYFPSYRHKKPIPVTVLSKAWDCSRSLTGIVGSNPA